MMTRRELFGSGAFGAAAGLEQSPAIDRRVLEQVVEKLDVIADQLVDANRGCATGVCPAATKIRDAMTLFLRANAKFPDFLDVGYGVFFEIYDWHVRDQPVSDFIGVPYDLRP